MSTAYRSQDGSTTDRGERTVGQLFAAATTDLSALVHDEIALAKQEIMKDVKRGAVGGGAGAIAAVIALASIPMFSFAGAYGLHTTGLGLAWCFLIMGGAFVAIAAIAGLLAVRFFKKISPPDRTIASSKATVDVLKNAKPRPAPTMKQM
ncbi:phage holin family protein [Streptacidiphilus sp. PB12-B1b]|uniref:phage holin family protein n=1 Tax=Streptacidiphilus sp. PB12-B1b TaxID=2705012 RepID=UPI0015FE5CBD|nr:phage holin family protein [Streptacidiphilus sp. PB12-B1b]QMU74670.1 phage holin family protein [Streptacidiphilus sp. PB12-B1b]